MARITCAYYELKRLLDSGDDESLKNLMSAAGFSGHADLIIANLKQTRFDVSGFCESLEEVRLLVQKQTCSICFCENPLNENTWLKYADEHKGFAVTYDFTDPQTYLCGREEKCKQCCVGQHDPWIFPVYYSDEKYDATGYAMALILLGKLNLKALPPEFMNVLSCYLPWQRERVSLIKKKCHEYDEEWRMLLPVPMPECGACVKLKPKSLVLGLRISAEDKAKVLEAAQIAGIKEIYKAVINSENDLELMEYKS